MYQHLYRRFLQANQGKQHFACHSHHYWPDVTRDAMLRYWDDSAARVDDKWDYFFSERIPVVQQKIAQILNTGAPQQLVFAPNTHELLYRILSSLDWCKPLKVLSTDSEFHSFTRQINRLNERQTLQLTSVPTLPFADFEQRFMRTLKGDEYDLVFISQVFFNSGMAIENLAKLVNAAPKSTLFVIDGYHGFMALPTDLSGIADRVFYLAGSYKYAQGGEGCCFAHIPLGCTLRPEYTGWFAEFGELDLARQGQVQYSTDGMRFAGSTMDFSALYRLEAVFDMLEEEHLNVATVHDYVRQLQHTFLQQLDRHQHPELNRSHLLMHNPAHHGHFLTFQLSDSAKVQRLHQQLKQHGIITDARGDRLRFGFALYQNAEQIDLSVLEQLDE
ncbi:aminotransferase class V-fold PLP-dependent enzyme [Lacimicrobium sp. SS2-24]|uniref:aminotransferase class V-fold PLP-dependent enzyme n=1 Tax=Lacimicrobium sp. SS2-24 TaxID=2005569 RepID=UPI000B4C053B|nr:aminotransferase class V-fold PLP-dependent enzyme [Lacimicrobium sp. SS2-24]